MKNAVIILTLIATSLAIALGITLHLTRDQAPDVSAEYGPAEVSERRYSDGGQEILERSISYDQYTSMGLADKLAHVTALIELRHEYEADGKAKVTISRLASSRHSGNFPYEVGQTWSSHVYEMMEGRLAGDGALLFFIGTQEEPVQYSFIYDGQIDQKGKADVDAIFAAYESRNPGSLHNTPDVMRLTVDLDRAEEAGHVVLSKASAAELTAILDAHDIAYQISTPDEEGKVEVLFYTDEETMDHVYETFASSSGKPCEH